MLETILIGEPTEYTPGARHRRGIVLTILQPVEDDFDALFNIKVDNALAELADRRSDRVLNVGETWTAENGVRIQLQQCYEIATDEEAA